MAPHTPRRHNPRQQRHDHVTHSYAVVRPQAVARLKVKSIRIDGSTPIPERHAAVSSFQKTPAVRVAVLGITAAGQGLTLTAADVVVMAELHWTPGVLVQAEDRAHRIGP